MKARLGWVVGAIAMTVATVVIPGCGKPADRCAAPSRAEIEMIDQVPALPPDIVALRDRWARASLAWVAGCLSEAPPDTVRNPQRKMALAALDDVLHLVAAPDIDAVAEFFSHQIDKAIEGIRDETPVTGARIWKLYNHGFVVRTADHCFAFDIFPGVGETTMSKQQMEQLARELDVMFISHRHMDHASEEFADIMAAMGKTVVINPDFWPDRQPTGGKLIRIGGDQTGQVKGINFTVFPGHQGDIPNNVYLVESDGIRVMHTGDQHNEHDLSRWIDGFSRSWDVDILLPNCWTLEIGRMVRGIAPRVVITGHENELSHTVDHRESFAKTYRQLEGLSAPYVVMTWGECYEWHRSK